MKKLLTLFVLCIAIDISGQDFLKNVSITGSADVYFRANITGPNDALDDEVDDSFLSPGTAFADRNGFSLGMANAILSYNGKKTGFVIDFVFGPRGEDAVFLSRGSSSSLNQLYVYYQLNDKIKFTLGNFNTYLGYELISPVGNFHYSTSYMFSNGPFSHTGLKANIELPKDFSLMLAIMNSKDFTEINIDGTYTLGAQLGYKEQFLNILYGDQPGKSGSTFQMDYTGGFDLTSSAFMGINATYKDTAGEGFYGIAIYPKYSFSEKLELGMRNEFTYFFNKNVNDTNVFASTLSLNYKIENLTIIPEYRIDLQNEDVYFNNDLEPINNLASFLIAAVYKI